jgi:PTS system fructose-specific IIA component
MSFSDSGLLYPDTVLTDLRASNAKQVFKVLAEYTAQRHESLCVTEVEEQLLEQEAQSPSGIGEGVAIVQMSLPELERPFVMYARMPNRIDIQAIDNEPVDLLVFLASPETGPLHLRRLSQISRMLRDRDFCHCLRSAETEDAVRAIWSTAEQRRLAA